MDSPLRDKLFLGRQWAFERLLDHLESQPVESVRRSSTSSNSKKPVVFILGGSGSGKTALLTEICFSKGQDSYAQRQYQLRKRTLAYHFCTSQTKKSLTVSDFLDNIAVQLSKSPFLSKLSHGETKFIRPSEVEPAQLLYDPDLVFREMILKKICEVNKSSNRHLYLVVDGLDECYEKQLEIGQQSSGSRTIAELLAAHVDQLPPWLHILTSSRRCSKSVVKMFATNKKIPIDDHKKDQIINDFKLYMRACLLNDVQVIDEHKQKDFQVVFEVLHEKSSGCFLYLELVIQALAQCIISTKEIRNIPNTLNGLYSFLFMRYYRSQYAVHANTEDLDLATMKQILSVLVASQIPMSRFDILDALVTRDCSKPYNPNHLEWQIRSLGFFLWKDDGVGYDEQCIQLMHHSFTSWITDVKLCGKELAIDIGEGHAMLALSAACFYDLNRVTSHDISEIVYNLSRSTPEFSSTMEVELMALWVLWIGLDAEKFNFHATAERDSVTDRIFALASDQYDSIQDGDSVSNEQVAVLSSRISLQEVLEVDHHGQTLLMRHLAAGGGNTRKLIEIGSNINHEDMSGWSPLIVACKCGSYEPIEVLLKSGAEINHRDYEGWTALRSAVWEGFFDVVCLLLSTGAHVDLEDNDQRTPLRAAAWRGFEDIARVLVQYGANVNQTDRFGQTPLNAAAYMGNCAIVELLLSSGARVDQTDQDGRTALTIACLYDQHEVAKRLLEAGADVNHQDKERISPLTAAAYKGNVETAKLLLKFPAIQDCGLNVELVDNGGRTALLAAASQGHLELVRLLIVEGGANCTVTDPDSVGCLGDVVNAGGGEGVNGNGVIGGDNIAVSFADGRSLLSVSCVQGSLDLVQWVLNSEYDEGSRDFCGWTPMHVAAFEGRVEVCRALSKAGLSVNDTDDEGRSPLICAAQEGHLDVVKFLVATGASIDHIAANSGQNALRVAALEAHANVVGFLLESGSNINLRDKDGRTTLYVLAQEDKLEMGQLFMEWRADVHLKDFDGRSPLMVAAWQGHFEMCQFLIQHGADINCVDIESRSVLQMAAWQGRESIIKLLCESGVDINSMCSQGATALTIAAQEGHTEVIECLLQYGADPLLQDKHGRSAYKVAMLSRNAEVKDLMDRAVEFNNRAKDDVENNNLKNAMKHEHLRSETPTRSERIYSAAPILTRVNSFLAQKPSSVDQTSASRLSHGSPSPPCVPKREPPVPPARPQHTHEMSSGNNMNMRSIVNNGCEMGMNTDGNSGNELKATPSLSSGSSPFSSSDNGSGEERDLMRDKFEQLRVTSSTSVEPCDGASNVLATQQYRTNSFVSSNGNSAAVSNIRNRLAATSGIPDTIFTNGTTTGNNLAMSDNNSSTSSNIHPSNYINSHNHHHHQHQPQHEYPNLMTSFNSASLSQIANQQLPFHQIQPNHHQFQPTNQLQQRPVQPSPLPQRIDNANNTVMSSWTNISNSQTPVQGGSTSNVVTAMSIASASAQVQRKPDNPMYIDVRQLQKSILMQARKQELEDREKKNKKRRKRNLFAKIHGLLSFGKASSKVQDESDRSGNKNTASSVLSDDEFSVSAFANSTCNTPRADQFTNVNQFSFASPIDQRKLDCRVGDFARNSQKKSASSDNSISDKKSADYRRLVDLSHLKNVDPLTSRSFRNYDRLGAIKAAKAQKQQLQGGKQRNYVPLTFQSGNQSNVQPNLIPGSQMMASSIRYTPDPNTIAASNPKKSYYISLAEIKKAPSRKPPQVPEDASKWFQPRGNKPPEVPSRNPKQLSNVFEHVNGMSKVVAQIPIPGHFVPNFHDLQGGSIYVQSSSKGMPGANLQQQMRTTSNSGAGALRNYVNQHELASRFQGRFGNPRTLETIEEPTGMTLESRTSAGAT